MGTELHRATRAPETMAALVISTGHLRISERIAMDGVKGRMAPAAEPWSRHPFAALHWDYGWLVYTDCARETSSYDREGREWPSMVACLDWAKRLGYDWLRFECDADRTHGLPWYEDGDEEVKP